MKQYVNANLTHDAISAIKYFIKMLAQGCEIVIFMFLGLSMVRKGLVWDSSFVLVTMIGITVFRIVGKISVE